jgi:hypothetical protein
LLTKVNLTSLARPSARIRALLGTVVARFLRTKVMWIEWADGAIVWPCAEKRACQSAGGPALSMPSFAERDHQQMLQALAYHFSGEISPVADERGDDLRRVG